MWNICPCQLWPTAHMFWIDLHTKNTETIWISPPVRLCILIQSEDAWKWDSWLRVVSTFSFWSPSLGPTSTIFTNFGYSCPVAVWGTYKGMGQWERGRRRTERSDSQQDTEHKAYVTLLAWDALGHVVSDMTICLLQRPDETREARHASVIA